MGVGAEAINCGVRRVLRIWMSRAEGSFLTPGVRVVFIRSYV
jgi:hypothetical protein